MTLTLFIRRRYLQERAIPNEFMEPGSCPGHSFGLTSRGDTSTYADHFHFTLRHCHVTLTPFDCTQTHFHFTLCHCHVTLTPFDCTQTHFHFTLRHCHV